MEDARIANALQLFSLQRDDDGANLARALQELVENSCDAGASRVQVAVEELDGAGLPSTLATGGAVFASPEHYAAAVKAAEDAVPGATLKPRDIVVRCSS